MKAMIDYGKTAAWVGRINGFAVSNIRGESATQRSSGGQSRSVLGRRGCLSRTVPEQARPSTNDVVTAARDGDKHKVNEREKVKWQIKDQDG